jgi:hypothetical protein
MAHSRSWRARRGVVTGRSVHGGEKRWGQVSGRVPDAVIAFNVGYELFSSVVAWIERDTLMAWVGKMKWLQPLIFRTAKNPIGTIDWSLAETRYPSGFPFPRGGLDGTVTYGFCRQTNL